MKRQPSTPCREWAERLIASHTDALPLSEYLVLKEHLLACPTCAEAHNSYLSVEAQIHNLPMLQPQRQLSARLLVQQEQKAYTRARTTHGLRGIAAFQQHFAMMSVLSYRVFQQFSTQIRKPVYIFIALLFCLLTAGMGAASFTFHNAAMQKAQAPHLAVSTTLLALSPANQDTSITLAPHFATEPFVFATNTLTLHNTGESPLTWQLDTTRSMVIFAPQEIKLWTVPSHGTLGRNEHSLIQVVAGGITRTELAAKGNIELG
jgi:hypothetical protein